MAADLAGECYNIVNKPVPSRVRPAPTWIGEDSAARLFGSFAARDPDVPCEYGLVQPIHSQNPLTPTCYEWIAMSTHTRAPELRAKKKRAEARFFICGD